MNEKISSLSIPILATIFGGRWFVSRMMGFDKLTVLFGGGYAVFGADMRRFAAVMRRLTRICRVWNEYAAFELNMRCLAEICFVIEVRGVHVEYIGMWKTS